MITRNSIIKRNIELWKPIEGFPGYLISNMGRIKSLGQWVKGCSSCDRFLKEKGLKPTKDKGGYSFVRLYKNKKNKDRTIHSLVIEHFGEPKPSPKHECNHKDGNTSNDWNTNLEWLTHSENIQHAYDNNLCSNKGEYHYRSKLSEKEVKEIRRLYATGKYTHKDLSIRFTVVEGTISYIINRRTWKHI